MEAKDIAEFAINGTGPVMTKKKEVVAEKIKLYARECIRKDRHKLQEFLESKGIAWLLSGQEITDVH